MVSMKKIAAALALLAVPARAQFPAPAVCAFFIAEALDSIANAVYAIMQAAEDCTVPTLSQKACTSDLTDMISYLSQLSGDINGATLACGSLDNECGATVSFILVDIADTANAFNAAASDCVKDPFLCTFDIVNGIDKMNGAVAGIIGSFFACSQNADVPTPSQLLFFFGGPGPFARRLTDDGKEAIAAPAGAKFPTPVIAANDPAKGKKVEDIVEALKKLQATLPLMKARLQNRIQGSFNMTQPISSNSLVV